MTVAELVEQLKQMPQESYVVFKDVWTEEEISINNVQLDDSSNRVELF